MTRPIVVFTILAGLIPAAPVLAAAPIVAAGKAGFTGTVAPFLKKHCMACHTGSESDSGIDLATLPARINTGEQAERWLKALQLLQADLMPPLKKRRPDAAERTRVIHWIETSVLASGHGETYRKKLLLPEFGNYVDHTLLFNGKITVPAYSPSRLWRLSPQIDIAHKGGRRKRNSAASAFIVGTRDGEIRDYAAVSKVDQSTIEMIVVAVEKMIETSLAQVKGGTRKKGGGKKRKPRIVKIPPDTRHRYAPFVKKEPPTAEQMQRLVAEEFRGIHRRLPSDAEREKYLAFLKTNVRVGGNLEAMKATVLALHLSPEAIYRMEIGLGPRDKHGRRRLSEKEIAYALGYALTDSNPYQIRAISSSLGSGKLKTQAGVRETVVAMLNTKNSVNKRRVALTYNIANPRIPRFFEEFFGYRRALAVFKDGSRKTQELQVRPKAQIERNIVKDLDQLIAYVLRNDKDVLKELLTTQKFLVLHPGDNELAKKQYDAFVSRSQKGRNSRRVKAVLAKGLNPIPSNQTESVRLYGLSHTGRNTWSYVLKQPMRLPHRKGILTHPAWLWAHSTNFDNDPIHRGIWIRRKLLAGVIADVPPDVDARVPEDPHKTLRQRLNVIRQTECWKCHQKINPLGETFEVFDDWGRYRAHSYFDQKKQLVARRDGTFQRSLKSGELTEKPIDASGELRGTGDPKLDGPVKDAFELIDRLAKSERVRQSFVRHAFRYFMGRNETLSDSQTLIAADKAYVQSGGSFKALVVSLLTSDSFLYRK